MARYVLTVDHEDPVVLPDDYSQAQEFLRQTISEFAVDGRLPGWRAAALLIHADNMPRAGFSFTLDQQMFRLERVK